MLCIFTHCIFTCFTSIFQSHSILSQFHCCLLENCHQFDFFVIVVVIQKIIKRKASTCFFPWSPITFACFSKAFPKSEKEYLAYSIISIWLEGNIYLLIFYCNFLALILLSIAKITFYNLSKRLRLRLTDYMMQKKYHWLGKEYGFVVHFCKIDNAFKVNIWWMINCNLLKLLFVFKFQNKVMGRI